MEPPLVVPATRRAPSADEAMLCQYLKLAADSVDQLEPESLEIQMNPVYSTAASFVPSADEVIAAQLPLKPEDDHCGFQVSFESVKVKMCPPAGIAASLRPSADEAIAIQLLVVEDSGFQVAPESVEV